MESPGVEVVAGASHWRRDSHLVNMAPSSSLPETLRQGHRPRYPGQRLMLSPHWNSWQHRLLPPPRDNFSGCLLGNHSASWTSSSGFSHLLCWTGFFLLTSRCWGTPGLKLPVSLESLSLGGLFSSPRTSSAINVCGHEISMFGLDF